MMMMMTMVVLHWLSTNLKINDVEWLWMAILRFHAGRDVVSVSTSRSRDGLVSVSSRTKSSTSRSRLGLGPMHLGSRFRLGLKTSRLGLGDMRLGSRLGLGSKGLVHIPACRYILSSEACFARQLRKMKTRKAKSSNGVHRSLSCRQLSFLVLTSHSEIFWYFQYNL